jgi:hypothetical protein
MSCNGSKSSRRSSAGLADDRGRRDPMTGTAGQTPSCRSIDSLSC